jgi:hypothetical protein
MNQSRLWGIVIVGGTLCVVAAIAAAVLIDSDSGNPDPVSETIVEAPTVPQAPAPAAPSTAPKPKQKAKQGDAQSKTSPSPDQTPAAPASPNACPPALTAKQCRELSDAARGSATPKGARCPEVLTREQCAELTRQGNAGSGGTSTKRCPEVLTREQCEALARSAE